MSLRMATIWAGGAFSGVRAARTIRLGLRASGSPETLTGLRKETREKESIAYLQEGVHRVPNPLWQ